MCISQLIFLVIVIATVSGSHFLGGTITWRPLNGSAIGTPVDIVIVQTYSWTYALITCTATMIAGNQLIPIYVYSYLAYQTLDCIANCGNGSTSYVPPSVRPCCTDFSAPIGTTVGQRSDTVSLQEGDDFSAAFQQNAWRPLTTSLGADWSISTHIIVQSRSDNGLYNNAPVATMMSPINIHVNQPTVIYVPVADADGDPIRCRWSTSLNGVDECGGVCPPSSLPPNTTIYSNCTIIITGPNVGDWFAVALMVEDFINVTSLTALSSVPVQFLVNVVSLPSCNTPPRIVGTPPEQSCTSVIIGQTFTSELIAINYCGASVSIVDIVTLSFPGMIQGNITELNSTTYYKSLSWTPTVAQLGYQVMCAMAFDSQNSQSTQYCFTFYVSQNGANTCPGQTSVIITPSLTGTAISTNPSSVEDDDSINWQMIGLTTGLSVLAILIFCCCIYGWYYYWLLGDQDDVNGRKRCATLYYIDCNNPKCRRHRMADSSIVFSVPRKNYRVFIIHNTV